MDRLVWRAFTHVALWNATSKHLGDENMFFCIQAFRLQGKPVPVFPSQEILTNQGKEWLITIPCEGKTGTQISGKLAAKTPTDPAFPL